MSIRINIMIVRRIMEFVKVKKTVEEYESVIGGCRDGEKDGRE